jgi:hypothetical protein
MDDLETPVSLPIFAKQLRGSDSGSCKTVRRVAIDPRFHQTAVVAARERVGLVVSARVAVRDSDGYSFCVSPAHYGSRKKVNVAVNHMVVAFAENPPEATAEPPRIRTLLARKDSAAKFFYFGRMHTRLRAERAKVELESVAVDVPQDVEKPRLDTAEV